MQSVSVCQVLYQNANDKRGTAACYELITVTWEPRELWKEGGKEQSWGMESRDARQGVFPW